MTGELETTIIENLILNDAYLRKVIPFLKKEYFTKKQNGEIFNIILEYFTEKNETIERKILKIGLEKTSLSPDEIKSTKEFIDETFTANKIIKDLSWLLVETESWCRDRSVYLSILKSIAIYEGSEKKLTRNAIPELLQNSLSITFDTRVGVDWVDDAEDRFNRYVTLEDKIPFGIEILNEITNGGAARKTANLIVAGTYVGKTMTLCHLAADYARLGYNVLYITLEMSEDSILLRIDANMLKTPTDKIIHLKEDVFISRIEQLKQKGYGKIKVIQFPTGSATALNFKTIMSDLLMKQHWKPDVLIVDYLGIVSSFRLPPSPGQSYFYLKSVSEELRALAVQHNIILWTASQLNRAGMMSNDVEVTDTAESMGIPHTMDFILALMRNEETDALNQLTAKQLKNRYKNLTHKPRFVLGSDFDRQLLYDVNKSEQTLIAPEPVDRDDVLRKFNSNRKNNFENFK